jgi:hypothetical protein
MAMVRGHQVQSLVPVAVKRDEMNVLAPGGVDEEMLVRRIASVLCVEKRDEKRASQQWECVDWG